MFVSILINFIESKTKLLRTGVCRWWPTARVGTPANRFKKPSYLSV